MQKRPKTLARELALKAILLSSSHEAAGLPMSKILKVLELMGLSADESQVEKNLRAIVAEPWPSAGSELRTEGGLVILLPGAAQITQREKDHPLLKAYLSVALWNYLWGQQDGKDAPHPGFEVLEPDESFLVAKKRNELRKKHMPSLWVDGGSTTAENIRQLLEAKVFPMAVRDPVDNYVRLIRPVIHTNSFKVAKAIQESSRHRKELKLRFVGGELQMDHDNVSGVLSDSCLDAWRMRGDVAILGATGQSSDLGVPTLCCDNIEEAHLKTRFLEQCWLRVVVADSSKFGLKNVTQSFVPINAAHLDLIVTDDGEATNCADDVSLIIRAAAENGVGCLVVKSIASASTAVDH